MYENRQKSLMKIFTAAKRDYKSEVASLDFRKSEWDIFRKILPIVSDAYCSLLNDYYSTRCRSHLWLFSPPICSAINEILRRKRGFKNGIFYICYHKMPKFSIAWLVRLLNDDGFETSLKSFTLHQRIVGLWLFRISSRILIVRGEIRVCHK